MQGKVDELLEKARLAMHERRFTEPAGDNALLYYRSAAAADASNGEAHDGLQRVAGVLGGTLRGGPERRTLRGGGADTRELQGRRPRGCARRDLRAALLRGAIAKALADGNLERAAALVRQAQQTGTAAPEQLAKWRADIARRVEDSKVTRLSGLVADRIRDGKLTDPDDSAKIYLQQLQAVAPAQPGNAARRARSGRGLPAQGA